MSFHMNVPYSHRAIVFVAHGAGEHCGYYETIAEKLAEKEVLVCAHDHGD